jgi:hypothetical protein
MSELRAAWLLQGRRGLRTGAEKHGIFTANFILILLYTPWQPVLRWPGALWRDACLLQERRRPMTGAKQHGSSAAMSDRLTVHTFAMGIEMAKGRMACCVALARKKKGTMLMVSAQLQAMTASFKGPTAKCAELCKVERHVEAGSAFYSLAGENNSIRLLGFGSYAGQLLSTHWHLLL